MTEKLRRWVRRGDSGQLAVEVVLIAPLLLVLVFLTFEFGRVFGAWLIVTNSAREGVRFAITQPFASTSDSAIINRVQRTAQGLAGLEDTSSAAPTCQNNQPPSGSTYCVGITRITCPNSNYSSLCGTTTDQLVIVLVQYQVLRLTPLAGTIPFAESLTFPASLQVTGFSTMRVFGTVQ